MVSGVMHRVCSNIEVPASRLNGEISVFVLHSLFGTAGLSVDVGKFYFCQKFLECAFFMAACYTDHLLLFFSSH